jgi:ketosteroid isomerase-like protein
MARTPQEIFGHHAQALIAGDLDEIVADYADDSVYITPSGRYRGPDEIRQAYAEFLAALPDAKLDVPRQIFEGDVLYLEWTAEARGVRVTDGTDTFVFGPDTIRVHTLHYSTEPTS